MLTSLAPRPRDALFYILIDPRPAGPALGAFQGQPIAAAVIDRDARRYVFAGIMPRTRSGQYDLAVLRPGEWIVEPGLIYRRDSASAAAVRTVAAIERQGAA
jgi:hypothetical protein